VDPSPPTFDEREQMEQAKASLRREFRIARRDHVSAQPTTIRGLLFKTPPSPVLRLIAPGATIGLYGATAYEAPTLPYAKWFHEQGYRLALPRFEERGADMRFHVWADPYDDDELETGPYGVAQPRANTPQANPQVLFVPLIAFTTSGARLGQGGGHYDRWLDAHPEAFAIGLAWDVQIADELPVEAHDRALAMIVTPTRLFEGKR
jgi:5-formyltetrahydrofolate cyclo-ligase